MTLDGFLEEFFSNITDDKGIKNIKNNIKENIREFKNYDAVKVEFQVFKNDENYDCDTTITSENYNNEEVVFVDCRINEEA